MASKDQIKKHLSMSSDIKFENTEPMKGDEARKAKVMEHIRKSKG
ncbi:MAG: hypothetical protein AAF215_00380 [Cyanobacteria bacterium P01_A01_bin.123]